MGGKGRDRTIYRNSDGLWANKRNDSDRASGLHTKQADAVAEAKEATKAANAAVEETRRIGEAQTRAYVDVVSGEIDGRIEAAADC